MAGCIKGEDRVLIFLKGFYVRFPSVGVALPSVQEKYLFRTVAPPIALNLVSLVIELKLLSGVKKRPLFTVLGTMINNGRFLTSQRS